MVARIMDSGMLRKDEREIETRWLDNVMIHITHPYEGRTDNKYPFSEQVLKEKYATQLFISDKLDFEYTYGERLNAWGQEKVDQIDYVIKKLKADSHSRRAVATTWDPRKDTLEDEVPCLNHFVFMTRDDFLDLSVMIRSNDMYGAWLANVYGLGELLKHVSEKTKISAGTITTLSVNAHVYSHDWDSAKVL